MKNRISIIVLLVCLLSSLCSLSRAQNIEIPHIEKQLLTIADTFRTKYESSSVYLSVANGVNFTYSKDQRCYTLTLPALTDLKTIGNVVRTTDEIARRSSYCSKVLAHTVNQYLVEQLLQIEDSLIKRGGESTAALTLITEVLTSELRYCSRFTDIYYMLDDLKRRHFSSEVITELKALLNQPYRTREEAAVVLASFRPEYTVLDTVGFAEKTSEYKSVLVEHGKILVELNGYREKAKAERMGIDEWLSKNGKSGFKEQLNASLKRKSELENYTNRVKSWIRKAEHSKVTLKQWLDSMQAVQDTLFIKRYTKESLVLWPIVSAIGQNYIRELAPEVEHLMASGSLSDDERGIVKLQLARMQVNDYERAEILRLDSEIKQADGADYGVLKKLFDQLAYINTQESFYATAPLLLNQADYNDLLETVPINARFFVQLKQHIMNLPWNEEMEVKELEKKGAFIFTFNNPWDVNSYLPKDFLKRMHQWMVDNRGGYVLKKE